GKEGWRIFRHALGTDPTGDALVFGEGRPPEQILQADLSPDGRQLAVYVRHGVSDDKVEVWVQDLVAKGPFSPIVDDLDASFYGLMADGHLFLRTNWKAPRWRIFDINLSDLKAAARDRSRWREVVPESAAVLTDFSLVGGKIVASYLENVSSRIRVFEPSGRLAREIPLPTLGSTGDLRGSWDSDEAFYGFTSFVTPPLVYRVSVATGRQEIWQKPAVPAAGAEIEVRQVWYPSKDGTRVPMFLVMKKGAPLDGDRPTWMTGYGGFNISLSPYYDPEIALWVEAGGVFAQPNLRGGGELGEEWHRAGMLDRKQNTFDDFDAAAEWLVANRYTRPARLAIQGGSNGGLLVGAAITQRPDLFQAAIAEFPLLDMVRYHRFLVANRWIPEYGSADDEKQFQVLYRYSPYHHVVDGTKYPAVLLVTGDADTRVAPLHARKMAARLQAATASERPILLQYALKAGHSGGLSREAALAETADQMAFLFWQLGVKPLPPQP
ncbi:MAG TPA: prolyl oligopeptidase family serine peptidase, partial [Thermoanaerobaculia bacterium]|nr:prolyl oligopeptidase family serine peptidase [Thermoanaerobaculia bacterium]